MSDNLYSQQPKSKYASQSELILSKCPSCNIDLSPFSVLRDSVLCDCCRAISESLRSPYWTRLHDQYLNDILAAANRKRMLLGDCGEDFGERSGDEIR